MSSKEFTAQQFRWLHQVNSDAKLQKAAVAVALQLTRHFDEDDQDGRAYPGYRYIGDAIGLSAHTVIRSVQRMHERGHLRVVWGNPGRSHPNQYWMILKPAPVQVLDKEKGAPTHLLEERKGAPTHLLGDGKGAPVNQKRCTGERKRCTGAPEPKDNLKENRGCAPGPDFSAGSEERVSVGKAEVTAAFARFWAVYPKRVGEEGARRAFAAAVKAGTSPEVIIEGASAYARQRAAEIADGDPERYTKHPANWLKEGLWDAATSGDSGRLLDQHGDDVVTPSQGNGRGPSWDDPDYLEKVLS